jgi:putative Holliday junction resolvase
MAIDFGRKRCGIAVTDALRIVANPLDTIDTPQLISFVKQYIARENVDGIVVGKPKNLNGEDSDSMRYLTPVINKLRKEVAPLPVTFFDERFTSVLAHRAMIDGGMHKMARRDKAVVDRISASIILNDFLNSQQNI